jgi:plasmid maintenance system antidote protein VapI
MVSRGHRAFAEIVKEHGGSRVAERLGVSPAYVSLLKDGERGVTELRIAARIDAEFGIPAYDWLTEWAA